MRVCFITTTSFASDPRALAEVNSTRNAGHEVVGVAPRPDGLQWVSEAKPRPGLLGFGGRGSLGALGAAARRRDADLYVPVQQAALPAARVAARDARSGYLNRPSWEPEDRSSVLWAAPDRPDVVPTASGRMPSTHLPGYESPSLRPTGPVVMVYRRTTRNPGRYLEAAFVRSGAETLHMDALDWEQIPPDAVAVVVVESPLPSPPVRGRNPGIPVVFWVHHGEHHLEANLRLQRRLGANVVALAHSWHLAYRFAALVERLPFAVAPELSSDVFVPHADRVYDVAFVGSTQSGARYRRRQSTLEVVSGALGPDRVAVQDGLLPEEMMDLYRRARIVPDDGAGRHLPITMRFFEALGAGALLVTREAPGSSLLLGSSADYIPMEGDGSGQLVALAGGDTEPIARAGHGAAWARHTYDRRVADLMAIVDRARSDPAAPDAPEDPAPGLARAVTAFPDAQRILDLESGVGADLADREVWAYHGASERAEPGTFHIAAIAGGSAEDRARAVAAARLAIVTPPALAAEVGPLVEAAHGRFHRFDREDAAIFTFGSAGYRASNEPDPE